MWIQLHDIEKNHKVIDNTASPRHDNLPENVTIQKWDIQLNQSIINNPRVYEHRLQQDKDRIWGILTSIHMYHKQNQTDNSRGNFTSTRK